MCWGSVFPGGLILGSLAGETLSEAVPIVTLAKLQLNCLTGGEASL